MEKSKYDWNTFKSTQDEQTLVSCVRVYRMADITHPAFDHLDNRCDRRVIRLAQSELKKASQDGYLEKVRSEGVKRPTNPHSEDILKQQPSAATWSR